MVVLVAAVGVTTASAEPAVISRLHWVTNGTVRAAAVHDQTLFIGGSFTRVAPARNLLGPWFGVSTASGEALPALPLTDAPVFAIEPDGAGGYFVGGRFTRIGGIARAALAHVLADGRVDPTFTSPIRPAFGGARPEVRTLARGDAGLYVGGLFTIVGGPVEGGPALLEPGSGAVRPWHPGPIIAEKIVAAGARVFVVGAGPFSAGPGAWSIDPITAATQWVRPLGSGYVYDAVHAGARLIVAGPFNGAGGVRGVASLDPATGIVDLAWGPAWPMFPPFPELRAVTVAGAVVYVGGAFTELAGQPRSNAAALDLGSGTLTAWAPQVDGPVRAIEAAEGGSVYLAGSFRQVGGQPRDALAKVDTAGGLSPWSPGAYSTSIRTLRVVGDVLLAGGTTAVAGGVARENLAAFALDTNDVRPWAPAMPFVVNELATDGRRVFAGLAHQYPVILPPGQTSVVALDAGNGLPAAWTPPAGDPWDLLGLVDGLVYLAAAGFANQFVRVDAETGAADPRWRVSPGPTVPRIFPVGDLIYLAGTSFVVDGTYRSYLAAVDRRTGALADWQQRALSSPPEGVLTVGGLAITGQTMFLNASTTFGTELLGLDIDSGLRVTPLLPGPVHASGVLAAADGWLLVTRPAAASGDLEVRALRTDGVLSAWNPGLSQVVPADFASAAPIRVVTTATDVIVTNVQGGSGEPVHGIAVLSRQPSSFPSALDGLTRGNVVRLTWTGSEPRASSYLIEAGSEPGQSDVASFRTGTSATGLETVAAAGTYFVRVRADDPGAPGPPSNEIALTVTGCSASVPPPTRLAAAIDGTTVTLTWEPSADFVRHYVIEAGSFHGSANLARISIPGDRTSFTTEAPRGTYFVRVRADTTCGTSAATPDVWMTVGNGALPPALTGLTVTGTAPVYTARWQPVFGAYYRLEVGSAPGLADIAQVITVEDHVGPASVMPGATYYLRVRAIGVAGMGPPGQEFVLTAR